MEKGTRRFPIKLEGSPELAESSNPEGSSESDTSNSNGGGTLVPCPAHDTQKTQSAMAWFMRLPSETQSKLLQRCIAREEEYIACCNERGVARREYFDLIRVEFNMEVPDCVLRSSRFVQDCIEELCKPRANLSRPLARPQNELEANIDR